VAEAARLLLRNLKQTLPPVALAGAAQPPDPVLGSEPCRRMPNSSTRSWPTPIDGDVTISRGNLTFE
jgi:hypothetical protein